MDCSTPGFPVQHQLPELSQTHVHWVGDTIQPSHPLLSPSPPAFHLSNESVLHIRWPKFWSFSNNPSKEYAGLISFSMDWLDLLALQGTLKSLLQHHSSKASILRHSAFFTVQLSHPYMTTGKTIALTRWTFVLTMHNSHYHCNHLQEVFLDFLKKFHPLPRKHLTPLSRIGKKFSSYFPLFIDQKMLPINDIFSPLNTFF